MGRAGVQGSEWLGRHVLAGSYFLPESNAACTATVRVAHTHGAAARTLQCVAGARGGAAGAAPAQCGTSMLTSAPSLLWSVSCSTQRHGMAIRTCRCDSAFCWGCPIAGVVSSNASADCTYERSVSPVLAPARVLRGCACRRTINRGGLCGTSARRTWCMCGAAPTQAGRCWSSGRQPRGRARCRRRPSLCAACPPR